MVCPHCGFDNRPGAKFCRQCGQALAVAPSSAPPSPAPPPPLVRPVASSNSSFLQSLAAIGLFPSIGQIAGLVAAVLAGLIVARVLPYIYPVLDPILTAAFGSGPSNARDGFNSLMMTVITILTSFVIALVTSLLFRRRAPKS